MTYVKKSAQILLVDDSQLDNYKQKGFAKFTPPGLEEKQDFDLSNPDITSLIKRVEALKLDLPDGLSVEQVKQAVEEAEKANAAFDLDNMKVDELKAYAEGKGIDISGLTKKEDILAKLKGGQ
jgi:hypothetical protein